MTKTVSILGATGSVGAQALDVAEKRGYKVDFLTAGTDVLSLEAAARKFKPRAVAMADERAARELCGRLSDTGIKVLFGEAGIKEGILSSECDTVINAILGGAGLIPTLTVIEAGKTLALANKESLVIAGDIVMSRAEERSVNIIPVDSEHSAIFQSLKSGRRSEIKKIILTASGGPFFGMSAEALKSVSLSDTLAHPTWKMGKKITVDSATLMNKGFEIIEATHLFGVSADTVQVVIHRESILHSAVEYIDNCIVGEFSVPDMRMCIQYAVDYPERRESAARELDLFEVGSLTFAKPDEEAFPLLALARRSAKDGGASSAVVNAADEVAVAAFLREEIGFSRISEIVSKTYDALSTAKNEKSLEGILAFDKEARRLAEELI